MNIRPMQGRILVKEIIPEGKTPGGLILPDSAKAQPLTKGLVIACGTPSPEYDCSPIVPEKIVLFVEYSSAEWTEDKEKYRFVRYEDIIGTLN